jgi:hypothetical protein
LSSSSLSSSVLSSKSSFV